MPCYHPLTVFRSKSGPSAITGKWPITFNASDGLTDDDNVIKVPCGQCIGCRLEKSKTWAIRCMHEAQQYKNNCFITLTYDNEHVNKRGTLNKRDFVLFMKSLRKKYGKNIRFFHCGEYGELRSRPHHHAAIFNFTPSDRQPRTIRNGIQLYSSAILNEKWGNGDVVIGDLTFESAAYIARYCTKKITGIMERFTYGNKLPPYQTMSLRPGLGRGWIEEFGTDIYPRDKIRFAGREVGHPPRYYDSIYDRAFPGELEKLKIERRKKINLDEQAAPRLITREEIQKLKMKKWRRDF